MSLHELSIKRPVFISCVVIITLVVGILSLSKLGVDQFPNVTFPVVLINTPFPGAGPQEVETLVSRPLEDELSTISGIKTLRSINKEGLSSVVAEFTLKTDIKYAEQQIRDRVSSAKRKLPDSILEPVIRRVDPADQPVLTLTLSGNLPEGQMFEMADQFVRPRIEQVNQVGLVDILGGRKREIKVELDRSKITAYGLSATQVSNRIAFAGQNIPTGKVNENSSETVFRLLGEFRSLADIASTVVQFLPNGTSISVSDLGTVSDSLEEEKARTFINGKKSIFILVFRQSGANTIEVVDNVKKLVEKINVDLSNRMGQTKLDVVRDGSKVIRANVYDVYESIILGIVLTILVVFFFLGSARSTFITGLALPNSLIGSFVLMAFAGFTINIMTLLALSLAVGLLIDDAIVVRENIFRHIEQGKSAIQAAKEGTAEVMMAVLATTLTVIAVFGPIAFLDGVVGQFFKEFGLTVCFAMLISLFDALTIAPMLSAYFAGNLHAHGNNPTKSKGFFRWVDSILKSFNKFQDGLENLYVRILNYTLANPLKIIGLGIFIFIMSLVANKFVSKTFLPPQDQGEFSVVLEMPPGTSLNAMNEVAQRFDKIIRAHQEVQYAVLTVGNRDGEANAADFFISMVPAKKRTMNTSQFKEILRQEFKPYSYANPKVQDVSAVGNARPFTLNVAGSDMAVLEVYAKKIFDQLKHHAALKDVDWTHKQGKPEFQVSIDNNRAKILAVSTLLAGQELRTLMEGSTPAVFREGGREFDIRVRLQEDQRNLKNNFSMTNVPNMTGALVPLSEIANGHEERGLSAINRQDRSRYIQIAADIAPDGPGLGGVIEDVNKLLAGDLKPPIGVTTNFVGQAENFKELMVNMVIAMALGVLFIYLVLASLYESFVTPFTIMLVLPLAACGAFYGLFITGKSLDLFSMIGCILLLGVATKNSILLVDFANQLISQGWERNAALIHAGKNRLRPILMTSFALIAGMLPVAIGLNEASKQRTSMGVAIIGGIVSSTLLTLVIIPAAFSYIDRFRLWSLAKARRVSGMNTVQDSIG